jgi:hypothetical protein
MKHKLINTILVLLFIPVLFAFLAIETNYRGYFRTPTPTLTSTPAATGTFTPQATLTYAPSSTVTPSRTPTIVPTRTSTHTRTPTPSRTPTATRTRIIIFIPITPRPGGMAGAVQQPPDTLITKAEIPAP